VPWTLGYTVRGRLMSRDREFEWQTVTSVFVTGKVRLLYALVRRILPVSQTQITLSEWQNGPPDQSGARISS